jgi:hypothetical protein
VVQIAQQMEQMLVRFAQAMPEGAQEFKQSADLLKQGIAKSMAAAAQQGGGEPPSTATSPTESGVGYSGGGLGSGARP